MAKEIAQAVPSLSPETRYILRVRTVNAFGIPSEWSEAIDMTTDAIVGENSVNWGAADGLLGMAATETITEAGLSLEDVTDMIVTTPDLPAGRIIRTTFCGELIASLDGNVGYVVMTDEDDNEIKGFFTGNITPAGNTMSWFFVETSTGGPITRKLRIALAVGSGSVSMYAEPGRAAQMVIEDLGGAL